MLDYSSGAGAESASAGTDFLSGRRWVWGLHGSECAAGVSDGCVQCDWPARSEEGKRANSACM